MRALLNMTRHLSMIDDRGRKCPTNTIALREDGSRTPGAEDIS